MASVAIYLNFQGNAEEAFNHYKKVFGGEFTTVMRFKDAPPQPGAPALSEEDQNKISAYGPAHYWRHTNNGHRYAGKHGA